MFTKRDYSLFDMAKAISNLSNHEKAQIGAVIVKGSDVISAAPNVKKTHPLQMRYNTLVGRHHSSHSLHAEMHTMAKVAIKKRLRGASIYISRTRGNDKSSGMCRPCPACMAALVDFGIRDIYYSTNIGLAYEKII